MMIKLASKDVAGDFRDNVIDSYIFVFSLNKLNNSRTRGEAFMIQVSVKADEMIQEFFKDREEDRVIRIFLSEGG